MIDGDGLSLATSVFETINSKNIVEAHYQNTYEHDVNQLRSHNNDN